MLCHNEFTLAPWQWVKDEPFNIDPLVTLVGGEEMEQNNLLLHPRQRSQTSVSQCGGKEDQVTTMELHTSPALYSIREQIFFGAAESALPTFLRTPSVLPCAKL